MMLKTLPHDIFHTLFPDLCLACARLPKSKEASFCVDCLHAMPYTDHFMIKENNVTKHLKGRIVLQHGAAILRFREGSIVQQMLHNFKYKGRKEIGEIWGRIGAEKMLQSPLFSNPDIIIPVPVHNKKMRKRGYNQSTIFGRSVGDYANILFRDDIIIKSRESASQTGKSRSERVLNVAGVFEIKDTFALAGRHVLIVDDVVTTGSTLEACCLKSIEAGAKAISILCIAAAE